MSKTLHYLYYLIFVLTISCNSVVEPPNEFEPPPDPGSIISINGYVYEYSPIGTVPSKYNSVYFEYYDTLYTLETNEQGQFTFHSNEYSDSINIRIYKNNYTSIDTIVTLGLIDSVGTVNLELYFQLNYLKSYFPIHIGDKWKYNLQTVNNTDHGNIVNEAIEQWELVDVAQDTSNITYGISYTRLREIWYPFFGEPDTTIMNETESKIVQVIISENGNLSTENFDYGFPKLEEILHLINDLRFCPSFTSLFYVYHPYNGRDTISVYSGGCGHIKYELVKDIGFNLLEAESFNGFYYYRIRYNLIEFIQNKM